VRRYVEYLLKGNRCLGFFIAALLASLVALLTIPSVMAEVNTANPPEGYEGSVAYSITESDQPKDKLIIKDVDPWGLKSPENALNYLGYSYDIIGSDDLPSVNLNDYKVVIIASKQPDSFYDNMFSYKDLLEEYVSSGGILVAHMCDLDWPYGHWKNSFLPGAPGLGHVNDYQNDLSIVDALHPIINGPHGTLTDDNLDGWGYSTHGYFTNLPSGAQILIGIADDPTGKPVYIWWRYGRGFVFATMQTVEWAYSWDLNKILLLNEIDYAQTLTAPPVGGRIVSTEVGQTHLMLSLIVAIVSLTIIATPLILKRRR